MVFGWNHIVLHIFGFDLVVVALRSATSSSHFESTIMALIKMLYGVKSKFLELKLVASVGVEQTKGVSVKDYLVDKLRLDDENRVLS